MNQGCLAKFLFIFALLNCADSFGQSQSQLNLPRESSIDHLKIWVDYPDSFDEEKRLRYEESLRQAIARANKRFSFQTEADGEDAQYELRMDMNPLHYPGRKDNLKSTIGNILFFGGQAALATGFGFCLPVLILFYPDTSSDVHLELADHKSGFILLSEKTITSNAYFASVQRQEKRFERAFRKSTFTTLKKLNRQNKRNIRQSELNLKL